MNWKNRLTNYNFWISIFSAVLLILQALKIEFDIAYVNEIFTAVLGLLVVIGIISDPTRTTVKTTEGTSKTEEVQEKTATTEDAKQEALPIDEENEIGIINSQNDFQTILNKITEDLEIKIKEIGALNKETASYLIELQNSATKDQHNESVNVGESSEPAVAEMDNPYIDVMN